MSRYFGIVVLMLLIFDVEAIDDNQKFNYIKALVEKTVKTLNIPGYSVGIVFNGTERKISVGLRNVSDLQSKVTDDTLFPIASCTKAFTAYALHSIIQEKNSNLHWSSKVRDVIPEFRMSDEFTTSKILVQDLLSHVSGLARHEFVWYNHQSIFNETVLLDKVSSLELHNDLREKYEYNNIMFAVAGIVMDRATGLSWHDNIKNRIFHPLNMSRSYTSLRIAQLENVTNIALPHSIAIGSKNVQLIPNNNLNSVENVAPAGSILSSISDMIKWIREHLREKNPFIKFLHHSRVPTGDSKSYGLGWGIHFRDGQRLVGHSGAVIGSVSHVALWPEIQLGVCILSNWDSTVLINPALTYRIRSVMINDSALPSDSEDETWILEQKNIIEQDILKESVLKENVDNELRKNYTIDDPEQFVGQYDNLAYGSVGIFYASNNSFYAVYNEIQFELRQTKFGSSDRYFALASFPNDKQRFECVFIRDFRTNIVSHLDCNFEPTTSLIRFQKRTQEKFLKHEHLSSFVGKYDDPINKQSITIKYDNDTTYLMATLNDGTFYGLLKLTNKPNRFYFTDNVDLNKDVFVEFSEDKLGFKLYTGNDIWVYKNEKNKNKH